MADHDRLGKTIKEVVVFQSADEYQIFEVGRNASKIEYATAPGSSGHMLVVQVFVAGQLYSEHPFNQVQSVYFRQEETTDGEGKDDSG